MWGGEQDSVSGAGELPRVRWEVEGFQGMPELALLSIVLTGGWAAGGS